MQARRIHSAAAITSSLCMAVSEMHHALLGASYTYNIHIAEKYSLVMHLNGGHLTSGQYHLIPHCRRMRQLQQCMHMFFCRPWPYSIFRCTLAIIRTRDERVHRGLCDEREEWRQRWLRVRASKGGIETALHAINSDRNEFFSREIILRLKWI